MDVCQRKRERGSERVKWGGRADTKREQWIEGEEVNVEAG